MADEDLRFAPSRTDLLLRVARTSLYFPDTDQDTDPMTDYYLTRGDTDDPLTAQCIGSDGDPVSLDDARIMINVTDLGGDTVFETSQAEPADEMDEPGWIRYEWRRRETEQLIHPYYKVSVTVRWSGDRIQTFPNDGSDAIMQVSDR